MDKRTVTENRIYTILQAQLYSMANNESKNVYEPLQLKWVLPIESTEGMVTTFKNVIYLLDYVQKKRCSRDTIDKIIENDIRPITNGLRDEYDFFIASTIMVMCNSVDNFSDTNKLMGTVREITGKFIYMLELAWECLESDSKGSTSNDKEVIHEIDTSVLKSGIVVKNYKEMCRILGEEICGGDSRKAQLKEWGRYFAWEKKGQKFIILDIYDEPFPKEDGRQNKNIYVQYIEVILMKILAKQRNNQEPFYITTNQLWKILGMINKDYKNISLEDLNDRISEYVISPFDMKKFYQRCNQRLREILFSSLIKMESRALIKYEIEIVIVYLNEEVKMTYKPANDIQKEMVLKAERKALLDMGLESKQHAYAKFKETEFFNRVNAYLNEWYGWEYTFNRIKIIYNKPNILEAVQEDEMKLRSDIEEIKQQRLNLNDKVVEALYKNAQVMAENKHKKSDHQYQEAVDRYMKENMMIGCLPESLLPTKKELLVFDYLPNFVEVQNRLTDELISIRKPQ